MPVDTLLSESALVLVDLQHGITALPIVQGADAVVARAARLAGAFRERGLPVALVRVAFSPDGGDVPRARTDVQPPPMTIDERFAVLREELGPQPTDLVITKRGWDAFLGTELDLQLRRRGIRGIVLGGIRTSIGVESTARSAFGLGYEVVVAADALGDVAQPLHDNSLQHIFPRLGRIDSTDAILAAPTVA